MKALSASNTFFEQCAATLQHTATHCNTLQHIAPSRPSSSRCRKTHRNTFATLQHTLQHNAGHSRVAVCTPSHHVTGRPIGISLETGSVVIVFWFERGRIKEKM